MKKLLLKDLLTKKAILVSLNVLLIVALVGGTVFFLTQEESDGGLVYEENARMGTLPGVDTEQRRLDLQNKLDDSMIALSLNTNPVFQDGTSAGNLMIENPIHNEKLLIVEVHLIEGNELIYKSNALKPNTYLESIKFDKILPKGEHPAYVYFNAYDLETEKFIGQTGAEINITVLN